MAPGRTGAARGSGPLGRQPRQNRRAERDHAPGPRESRPTRPPNRSQDTCPHRQTRRRPHSVGGSARSLFERFPGKFCQKEGLFISSKICPPEASRLPEADANIMCAEGARFGKSGAKPVRRTAAQGILNQGLRTATSCAGRLFRHNRHRRDTDVLPTRYRTLISAHFP